MLVRVEDWTAAAAVACDALDVAIPADPRSGTAQDWREGCAVALEHAGREAEAAALRAGAAKKSAR